MDRPWPVAVTGLGPAAAGTRLWKGPAARHLTIVVKVEVELVHDGDARVLDAAQIAQKDRHYHQSPGRSLEEASDLAPYLARCDVTLRGHAHAPPGQPVPAMGVRLLVYRGAPVLEKKLYVIGERTAGERDAGPFQLMPLDWEHALGGKDHADNPVGRSGEPPRGRAPNVLDPVHAERSAGFAPLSRFWGLRARLLAGAPRRLVDADEPEIAEGFDWRYFQAAPPDQQVPYLAGDEWIVLDGLHAALARVSSRLPSLRGEARVFGMNDDAGAPRPVALHLDTLAIDADRLVAGLVWRGSLALESGVDLARLQVVGAVASEGASIEWPALVTPEIDEEEAGSTRLLTPDAEQRAALAKADPFSRSRGAVLPPPEPRGPAPPSAGETVTASDFEVERGRRAAVPFGAPREANAPAASDEDRPFDGTIALPSEERPFASTIAVAPDAAARPATPFAPATPAVSTPAAPAPAPPPAPATPAAPGAPAIREARAATPATKIDFGETVKQSADEAARAAKARPLPFAPADPNAPPAAAIPEPPGPREPAPDFGGTVSLRGEALAQVQRAIAPFPLPAPRPRSPVEAPAPPRPPRAVPRRESPQVPIVNPTALAAAVTPWQLVPPTDVLTFLVKGTFDLVHGGPATLRDEADPPTGDVHADDDRDAALLHASDFAVVKPRADVVLTGHAYAPRGSAARARVTFRFGGGSGPRGFTRSIDVIGDRSWQRIAIAIAPGDPAPFERVPLVYERAFGGKGHAANPLGTGLTGSRLPNLEDPEHPIKGPGDTPPPACFGPVPPLWKERWSKLGTFDAAWLASRWPYFPADFDPSYFQAAPRAQTVEHLRGDEAFEITGMHPEHPKLAGALPGVRPRAFALATAERGGALTEIPLRLDTASFDVDAMKVNLVWRGLCEVSDDEAPEIETFFIQLEDLAGEPLPLGEVMARLVDAAAPDEPEDEPPSAPPAPLDAALAAALRESVIARLALGASFDGADLAGADLSGLDLAGRSFAGAILKGAKVAGAKLAGADLSNAVLAGADLGGCDLGGAKLAGADLVGATLAGATLDGADLEDADLSLASGEGATFLRARGAGVQFAGGGFAKARFDGAELPGADFTRTGLAGASFAAAILSEVRLYYATAEGARFDEARLDEARADDASLVRCSFTGVHAPSSIWEKATLTGSSFAGATLQGASFSRATCDDVDFHAADASLARFVRAKLTRAVLTKANLREADLERADLTGADLRGANLHAAETWKARREGALLDGAIVTRSKLAGPRS